MDVVVRLGSPRVATWVGCSAVVVVSGIKQCAQSLRLAAMLAPNIWAQINSCDIRYGVVANIIASHAIARGSIPRVGIFFHDRCFFSRWGQWTKATSFAAQYSSPRKSAQARCEVLQLSVELRASTTGAQAMPVLTQLHSTCAWFVAPLPEDRDSERSCTAHKSGVTELCYLSPSTYNPGLQK